MEESISHFVQNKQMACAILEDKCGNEYKGEMNFIIRTDEGDEDNVGPDEDESGNVWVRRAISGHMIEEYETDETLTFKQGQT
jgi:hypothetical protein